SATRSRQPQGATSASRRAPRASPMPSTIAVSRICPGMISSPPSLNQVASRFPSGAAPMPGPDAMAYTRDDIVAEARRWIGTPYPHQASVRGIGTDCLGLVRGVWRALHGPEAEVVPAYARDWAEATGIE